MEAIEQIEVVIDRWDPTLRPPSTLTTKSTTPRPSTSLTTEYHRQPASEKLPVEGSDLSLVMVVGWCLRRRDLCAPL
jgi:hypothetical protein